MTKGMSKITWAAALMIIFSVSICLAEDANRPETNSVPIVTTIRGTVGVIKDANGILAVNMTTDEKKVINFVLDDDSRVLAKFEGKELSVTIMKKDGQFKVVSYSTANKPSPKATTKPAPKSPQKPGTKPTQKPPPKPK